MEIVSKKYLYDYAMCEDATARRYLPAIEHERRSKVKVVDPGPCLAETSSVILLDQCQKL